MCVVGAGWVNRSVVGTSANLIPMTLAAVWCSHETPGMPTLWMASDSRISDGHKRLIDEGIKLYEVPVVCRWPSAHGLFACPCVASLIVFLCAGVALVF